MKWEINRGIGGCCNSDESAEANAKALNVLDELQWHPLKPQAVSSEKTPRFQVRAAEVTLLLRKPPFFLTDGGTELR